jgi:hypothetical protein
MGQKFARVVGNSSQKRKNWKIRHRRYARSLSFLVFVWFSRLLPLLVNCSKRVRIHKLWKHLVALIRSNGVRKATQIAHLVCFLQFCSLPTFLLLGTKKRKLAKLRAQVDTQLELQGVDDEMRADFRDLTVNEPASELAYASLHFLKYVKFTCNTRYLFIFM